MKAVVLVPDGVGVRNFLCTGFVDLLQQSGEVRIWHGLPSESISAFQERWGKRVAWECLPQFREGITERALRKAKIYAQLYWREEQGTEVVLKQIRASGHWTNRVIGHTTRLAGRICADDRRIVWLDRLHAHVAASRRHIGDFEDVLNRAKPDIVFCSHQRASRAVPAMLAARRLSVPTATFIYSWDNLPKGRMAVHADGYLVWSEHMKDQLLTYYPELVPESVYVVGTPQFEHYANNSLAQGREEFLRSLKLDHTRPLVLFSGDDVTTSPHDEVYLADLAEALREIPLCRRPQILFRRCPVDKSDRYNRALDTYPEIAVSDPLWSSHVTEDWTQVVPSFEDTALLHNVVRHCDLVVNVGSTMAMDFALFDKPAIFIAYNPRTVKNGWNIDDVYRLPHFSSVNDLQPVYWARSPDVLANLVLHALDNVEEKRDARRAWLKLQLKHPIDRASERCHQALLEIARTSRSSCT